MVLDGSCLPWAPAEIIIVDVGSRSLSVIGAAFLKFDVLDGWMSVRLIDPTVLIAICHSRVADLRLD